MRSHGLEVPEGGVLYAGIMIYENGGDVARRILKMDPLPTPSCPPMICPWHTQ